MDNKYFTKMIQDPNERFEFAQLCAKYVKYRFVPKGEEVFYMGKLLKILYYTLFKVPQPTNFT